MGVRINTKEIGKNGEQLAAKHLESKGFTLVCCNYHSRYGEVDVIAQNQEFILFVEVKTRKSGSLFMPSEAVTLSKKQKLVKTAKMYLQENPCELQPRFDIIEVVYDAVSGSAQVHQIENAFGEC